MQKISLFIESLTREMFGSLAEKFPLTCASDEFYFFPHYKLPVSNWKTWDHFSEDCVSGTCRDLSSFESELSALAHEDGDRESVTDIRLLSGFSRTLREQLSEYKTWKKQPSFYLTLACFGLEQALRSEDPVAIHDRASGLPAFLDHARLNLEAVPEIYMDIALQMLDDIFEFVESLIPQAPELVFAIPALERFRDTLHTIQTNDQKILSAGVYEKLLRDHLVMDLDLKEIEEIVDHEYLDMRQVMNEESRKLSFNGNKEVEQSVSWVDTYHSLPEPDIKAINKSVLYRTEIESLRMHCRRHGLIPGKVDISCPVSVASLPSYLAAIRSSSSYSISPDILAPGGTFFVLESLDTSKQYQENLREYRMLTSHETYPGHHLLDACRLNLVRQIRRSIELPLFYEGWACFAEELCHMTGYFNNPGDRLILAKRRFWRAARGKVDIGIHTGKMNILAAGEFMKKAGIPVEGALSSVRKYTLNPGYQLCYTVGLVKFLELNKKYSQLPLSEFVKTVLLNGETFIPY